MIRARNSSSRCWMSTSGMRWKRPSRVNRPSATRAWVRVKIKVFAKRLDAHDDAGKAVGQVQGGLHVFQQAFVGDGGVILEQGAIEAEIRPEHFGDAKRAMAVRHGEQNRLGEQRAEKLDLLLVAGRARQLPIVDCGLLIVSRMRLCNQQSKISNQQSAILTRPPQSRNLPTTSGMMGRKNP